MIKDIEPPEYLLEKILKHIHREERILALRKIAMFSLTLALSLVAFTPALNMLISDAKSSGFAEFLSLIFSDFSMMIVYWRSFMMALLETLPAVSIALFLAVIITLLQSIKSLSINIKTVRHLAT